METADLHKPAKLYIVDDERRTWRTLWLRRRVRQRLIFAGYLNQVSWSRSMYGPSELSISMEDAMSRLQRTSIVRVGEKEGDPPSQPTEKPQRKEDSESDR